MKIPYIRREAFSLWGIETHSHSNADLRESGWWLKQLRTEPALSNTKYQLAVFPQVIPVSIHLQLQKLVNHP